MFMELYYRLESLQTARDESVKASVEFSLLHESGISYCCYTCEAFSPHATNMKFTSVAHLPQKFSVIFEWILDIRQKETKAGFSFLASNHRFG